MSYVYVWRVEYKRDQKVGPFYERLSNHDRYRDMTNHPTPYLDGLGDITGTHHFGCRNLAQLKSWFGFRDVVDKLRYDYVVARYEVNTSAVKIGKRQVAFRLDQAQRTKILPVDSLL